MSEVPEIPETMTAVQLTGTGGPEMLVVREDVPVPVPGADEVLVRVRACGMNNTDINTRVGWYSKAVTGATTGDGYTEVGGDGTWGGDGLAFPRIQGADPCGVVVSAGSAADPSLVGRRGLADGWIRDVDEPSNRELAGYLGSERDGGFAQFCAIPARNVYPVESSLTDAELASFPCSWSTAEHMLARPRVAAGDTVVVTGASGGVGSALVQLAKLRGARVVALTSAAKTDLVAGLGADAVVVLADVVGGADFAPLLEVLRRGGRYTTAGAIAGPIVDLDLRTLYLNDLELYGCTVYEPSVFADLVGHIQRGDVQPVVAATFPLAEIHAAQEAFAAKAHVGAMVIEVP